MTERYALCPKCRAIGYTVTRRVGVPRYDLFTITALFCDLCEWLWATPDLRTENATRADRAYARATAGQGLWA